ncbi:MAG: hypothetical protein DRP15_03085 [Candidatus Aenigmatarchaeota archaeon]|nr:MAG: hypothetical protein DRP15_03085 [Candidatus Aenigmarchaeota archaeon]
MKLVEIAEEGVLVTPEDTVTHVASSMFRERKPEAAVLEDGELKGIVVARDLVKRKISNPDKTKIENFVRNVGHVLPGTSIDELISMFLINDFTAVPFKTLDNKILFITKLSILNELRDHPDLSGKKASDVMTVPFCITTDDTLATARSIIRDLNLSRLPVTGKEGRFEGLIESVDLLKAIIPEYRSDFGFSAGERIYIDDVQASSFMNKDVVTVEEGTPLRSVIDQMVKKKTAAVVLKDEKIVGMISPKDILRLLGEEKLGFYINVSGLQEEDEFIKSIINEEITRLLDKVTKIVPINYMAVRVEKHHKTGTRAKYSFRARLSTQKGVFYSDSFDWDVTKAAQKALERLWREILKKKETVWKGNI